MFVVFRHNKCLLWFWPLLLLISLLVVSLDLSQKYRKLEGILDIDVWFISSFYTFLKNINLIHFKSVDLIRENWDSGYVFNGGIMQDFFSVFAVYFPAGIGILAGANISGDLKVSLLDEM